MSASIGDHMRCPEGTLIHGRYRVVKEVGCGNFAKVYKCQDTRHPENPPIALKVLKREYATDASFELEMLKALRTKSSGKKVIQMLDHFQVNNYPCFVFKLAGPTLRARKFGISKGAVNINDVHRLSKDLISTLGHLHHDIRLVHTDLKPENILLDDPEIGNDGIGSGWTIADFGSASFFRPERPDSDLISTRPYRAPEVVLGMPWSPKADVWSMACILFEVYYGGRLFEVHDDHEHLNKFQQRLGKIPISFARPSKLFRRFFDDAGNIVRRPTTPVSRTVGEILRAEPEFFDMITKMLHFDPNQRMSCNEALAHPFMSGAGKGIQRPRLSSSSSVDADAASNSNNNNNVAAAAGGGGIKLVDKENAANVGAVASKASAANNNNNAGCVPGTSIPLPPSAYGGESKAKWQQALERPPAGVASARVGLQVGNTGPSSRKLF